MFFDGMPGAWEPVRPWPRRRTELLADRGGVDVDAIHRAVLACRPVLR
ncbi:hypothetical protein [Catellatospora sp. NPDC049133]|jgi:hypothetical protein